MNDGFIPQQQQAVSVPFFEDATSDDGWQGHTTTKSLNTLQSEIIKAMSRMGGLVATFQRVTFLIDGKERDGFRIHYSLDNPLGKIVPGRIDIAALPVKMKSSTYDRRANQRRDELREKSLRMALYMFRDALNGLWFLQQLSPGYAALMPWMLVDRENTVTDKWLQSPIMQALFPPPGTFQE